MSDIACCDVLDKIMDTAAGPVNVIKNKETGEQFLAFFVERNNDYPEFQSELGALTRSNWPQNILRILIINNRDPSRNLPMSIVTEYPEKFTLASLLKDPKNLTKYEIGVILFSLANSLRECRTLGVPVLELSPTTVFVASDFSSKLAFPGVRAFVNPDRCNSDDLNVQYYVPPELWTDEPVTSQACLYSYGMILFQALSQEIIFQKTYAGTSFRENILAEVRPIIPPAISPMARTVITRCWGSDPEDRPSPSDIMKTMLKNVEFFFGMAAPEAKKLFHYQRSVVDRALDAGMLDKEEKRSVQSPRPKVIPRPPTPGLTMTGQSTSPVMPRQMSRSQSDMKLAQIDFVSPVPELKEKGRVYALAVAKFQRFLMQITKYNKEETIRKLLVITPKDDAALVARNLFIAAQCLYMELRTLAQLVGEYVKAAGKRNKFGMLKQEMLRLTYESLSYGDPMPKDIPRIALLTFCLDEKVFQSEEIVAFVKNFYEERWQTRKKALCLMFAWFAPEIDEVDPELCKKMEEISRQVASFHNVHAGYSNFVRVLPHMKDDNWSRLKIRRLDMSEKKLSVSYILRHDDALNLKRAVEQGSFMSNKLASDIHVPCVYLHEKPSLLMYAAAYQAINCFQFLEMKKRSSGTQKDDKYRNLSHFAIAGGNLTIVRFVDNDSGAFDSGLQVAAACHKTSIFAHFFKSVGRDLDTPDKFGKKVITTAAAADNISIVLFCLSRKVSISSRETFGVCF